MIGIDRVSLEHRMVCTEIKKRIYRVIFHCMVLPPYFWWDKCEWFFFSFLRFISLNPFWTMPMICYTWWDILDVQMRAAPSNFNRPWDHWMRRPYRLLLHSYITWDDRFLFSLRTPPLVGKSHRPLDIALTVDCADSCYGRNRNIPRNWAKLIIATKKP